MLSAGQGGGPDTWYLLMSKCGIHGHDKRAIFLWYVVALLGLDAFLSLFWSILTSHNLMPVYLMPAGMYDNYYSIFTVFLSLHSCLECEKLPHEKQLRNISGEDHREHIYVNTVINHFFQLAVTKISDGKNLKVCQT